MIKKQAPKSELPQSPITNHQSLFNQMKPDKNFVAAYQLFKEYLEKQRLKDSPAKLYEPINYLMDLGGKSIRPTVLLLAHQLYSDDTTKALAAAYSIEMFHNFSLMHDDIMDEAPLRRGQPTVHEKYDLNTGILSGDAMLVMAYSALLKTESPRIVEIMKLFSQTALEVCIGQQYDMDFQTQKEVTIPMYIEMISLKTSVLVAAALKIGALIADAPEVDAEHLYQFGRSLGIAFQIHDDFLDAFGNPEKVGKKVGGDIAQNKKTYLWLKSLEIAQDDHNRQLQEALTIQDEGKKIEKVLSLYTELDIPKLTQQAINAYYLDAINHLDAVDLPKDKKESLYHFAAELMERDF